MYTGLNKGWTKNQFEVAVNRLYLLQMFYSGARLSLNFLGLAHRN
jgi:hypothetical protein